MLRSAVPITFRIIRMKSVERVSLKRDKRRANPTQTRWFAWPLGRVGPKATTSVVDRKNGL